MKLINWYKGGLKACIIIINVTVKYKGVKKNIMEVCLVKCIKCPAILKTTLEFNNWFVQKDHYLEMFHL